MYLAIFHRFGMKASEAFDNLPSAVGYLQLGRETGDLYPLCVYDDHYQSILWRFQWPNQEPMTDEDLRPDIDYILTKLCESATPAYRLQTRT